MTESLEQRTNLTAEQQPVAWRWRAKGAILWVYDPTEEWRLANADKIEMQALYAAPLHPPRESAAVEGTPETIANKLRAVLCDPEGNPCIIGSEGDLNQISDAILEVEQLERQRNALQAQSDAQLRELTAISDALGTNEGHSSVDHILALQAKLRKYRSALEEFAPDVLDAIDEGREGR